MVLKNPYCAEVPSFASSPGMSTYCAPVSATTCAATTVGGGFAPAPGCMSATAITKIGNACGVGMLDVAAIAVAVTVSPVCITGAGMLVVAAIAVAVTVSPVCRTGTPNEVVAAMAVGVAFALPPAVT